MPPAAALREGASSRRPKSCDTVTVTLPDPASAPEPKPQPDARKASRTTSATPHRTVKTTRVVPRASGVRLPALSIAIASST